MTETETAMFPRVAREPRLSDKVAELLLETILSRGLQPGDRLPSERELGEQFGVSRTVIREAVRALAAKGMIDVRTGSGLRVAAVDASAVSESIGLYLRGGSLDYAKVHEVRKLLEIEIAGLAAVRASPDHIERLGRNCDEMEQALTVDVELASRLDLEFHREVARATDNELYLLLLDSVGEALLEIRRANLQSGAGPETIRSHRRIFKQIAAHDREGARRAMEKHLAHVERVWRTRTGDGKGPRQR
jgi:GntR family transcriptional regulator, transcriptional repressor for pyruvate dehydrogenase complex